MSKTLELITIYNCGCISDIYTRYESIFYNYMKERIEEHWCDTCQKSVTGETYIYTDYQKMLREEKLKRILE